MAQAIALKASNEALEKELDCIKINYNKLDDECADLWRERLLQEKEPLSHHRKLPPAPTRVNFGWDIRAYLGCIERVVEKESHGEFVSVKEKIISEEEKFERRVKLVLLARDVLDGKGYGRRNKDPSIGYFGIDDVVMAQSLVV